MRHDIESYDQGGEDRDMTWLDVSMASVKGKLSDDLAPMDQSNHEEQVKSRSMNQYDHVMITGSDRTLASVGPTRSIMLSSEGAVSAM